MSDELIRKSKAFCKDYIEELIQRNSIYIVCNAPKIVFIYRRYNFIPPTAKRKFRVLQTKRTVLKKGIDAIEYFTSPLSGTSKKFYTNSPLLRIVL